MWHRSFVAMTVLTGGTADDAARSLGGEAAARASDLLARLGDPRRAVRAAAIADAAKDVALAIDEVTLR